MILRLVLQPLHSIPFCTEGVMAKILKTHIDVPHECLAPLLHTFIKIIYTQIHTFDAHIQTTELLHEHRNILLRRRCLSIIDHRDPTILPLQNGLKLEESNDEYGISSWLHFGYSTSQNAFCLRRERMRRY